MEAKSLELGIRSIGLAALLSFSIGLAVRADDFNGNVNGMPMQNSVQMPYSVPMQNGMPMQNGVQMQYSAPMQNSMPMQNGVQMQYSAPMQNSMPMQNGVQMQYSVPMQNTIQIPSSTGLPYTPPVDNSVNAGMNQQSANGFGTVTNMQMPNSVQMPNTVQTTTNIPYSPSTYSSTTTSSFGSVNSMPVQTQGSTVVTGVQTNFGGAINPSSQFNGSVSPAGQPVMNSSFNGSVSTFGQQPVMNGVTMTQSSYQPTGVAGSHPLFSRLKGEFWGTNNNQNGMPGQTSTQPAGAMGMFKDLFGPPGNVQDAEQRAQADLNTAENHKQQAINLFNQISAQSDRSKAAALANQLQNHAKEARNAADKVFALSNQFQSSNMSNIASQAQAAASYAQQMADQAESKLGAM